MNIVVLHQSRKSHSLLSKKYDISPSAISRLVKQYSDVKPDGDSINFWTN